ncbi:MAG: carbon-nitrogen hydrolase [Candidatus Melainabacteria bacterium]|nr:carbon-nitrogen hydrolase [Candidatus Melainabacteria bacterium]
MPPFKAAWIQGKSQGDFNKNLKYYSEKIYACAKSRAKLVILPELFLWDYFPITENKKNFETAISIKSEPVKHFQVLAKELKIVLTLPIFEKRAEGIYHNSCLIIENNGDIVGHYRKMHVPDDPGFYEKYYFTPGDIGFVVTKTSLGNIGVLICWDQWFPEAARITALKGADILIYPTAIGWDDNEPCSSLPRQALNKEQVEAWTTIMKSHAIANGIYVMAVNRTGKEGHLNFWGHSFLANPYGCVVHQDKTTETTSEVEIDFSKTKECRQTWPFLRDRRTDKYQTILKSWDSN